MTALMRVIYGKKQFWSQHNMTKIRMTHVNIVAVSDESFSKNFIRKCYVFTPREILRVQITIWELLNTLRKNSNKNYRASPVFLQHFHFPAYFIF